jgi:hypothetical protein
MNGSSHSIDENHVNTGSWDGSPLMGLGMTGVVRFPGKRDLKPPRERPRGGGGTYRNGGMGASAPIIKLLA